MGNSITQQRRPGCFLVSEAQGHLSRHGAWIAAGQVLEIGTVLGQIAATKKYRALTLGASDGSQIATAILYDAVDTSTGDAMGQITDQYCEVNGAELVWPESISAEQRRLAIQQLAHPVNDKDGKGIIVR